MLLLLLACTPEKQEPDDSTSTIEDSNTTENGYSLLIATTDYTVGAIATLEVTTGHLEDALLSTGPDNAVAASGGKSFVLGRSSENTVRVYGHDFSEAPEAEFSTGDNSNPTDVAVCGGLYVVSLYNTNHLGLYHSDGLPYGTVDLSQFDDGTSSPEPDSLYAAPNGFLYLSLNELDANYRSADGSGTIVKIDCSTWNIVGHWDTAPNAHFIVNPSAPSTLIVYGGNYFTEDFSTAELDGGVYLFDTTTDTQTGPVLREEDQGYNIGFLAFSSTGGGVLVGDDGFSWTVYCALTAGDYQPLLQGDLFVNGGVVGPDGMAWLAVRPGYSGVGTQISGVTKVDPETCAISDPILPSLPPNGLAVIGE